ncbi:cobalt-zinc-cadmium resistance protein CzcA [Klebsiella pneumoniae]|uniref:Cobalt-zinc-cadmium resistance protein CzcA n=1 Tax=Klebsiella pneumoniae TaxID=573 RepID=A0A3S4GT58_KLEPN|nr:cobalt-zinc-cadmium resistance protein CzcA [Klebsiella pneumoniae]
MIVRPPEAERQDANHLNNVLVWSQSRQQYIPLSNVINGFALEWEDPLILRRDRTRVLDGPDRPQPAKRPNLG